MIVLDEQLADPAIRREISRWYRQVRSLQDLGLSGTADPALPRRLLEHRGCTFVTINYPDFWGKLEGDPRIAVICVRMTTEQAQRLPRLLRRLLLQREFRSISRRRGKVISVTHCGAPNPEVRYYRRRSEGAFIVQWEE